MAAAGGFAAITANVASVTVSGTVKAEIGAGSTINNVNAFHVKALSDKGYKLDSINPNNLIVDEDGVDLALERLENLYEVLDESNTYSP